MIEQFVIYFYVQYCI